MLLLRHFSINVSFFPPPIRRLFQSLYFDETFSAEFSPISLLFRAGVNQTTAGSVRRYSARGRHCHGVTCQFMQSLASCSMCCVCAVRRRYCRCCAATSAVGRTGDVAAHTFWKCRISIVHILLLDERSISRRWEFLPCLLCERQ